MPFFALFIAHALLKLALKMLSMGWRMCVTHMGAWSGDAAKVPRPGCPAKKSVLNWLAVYASSIQHIIITAKSEDVYLIKHGIMHPFRAAVLGCSSGH